MFERLHFMRYALRFERAVRTDDWAAVKACFHPDARYVLACDARYDGDHVGRDAIAALFKRMLDEFDRKFDQRKPGLRGWPRVDHGALHFPWKVTYIAKTGRGILTGDTRCRFAGGKILELVDTAPRGEWKRLFALIES